MSIACAAPRLWYGHFRWQPISLDQNAAPAIQCKSVTEGGDSSRPCVLECAYLCAGRAWTPLGTLP